MLNVEVYVLTALATAWLLWLIEVFSDLKYLWLNQWIASILLECDNHSEIPLVLNCIDYFKAMAFYPNVYYLFLAHRCNLLNLFDFMHEIQFRLAYHWAKEKKLIAKRYFLATHIICTAKDYKYVFLNSNFNIAESIVILWIVQNSSFF